MKPEDVYLPQVLFEMQRQGNYVRVIAVDPRSNTEITMVGDRNAGDEHLKRLAIRKLKYVIAKRAAR